MLSTRNLVLVAIVAILSATATSKKLKLGDAPKDYTYPYKIRSKADLPRNFTWGNVNGKNFLTRMRNQHIPQYCGSCWAHGTTSVMSDRINIMRGAPFPEINIAVQPLLDFDYVDQGCHGGDFRPAFEWIKKNGIVDEACSQYRAQGWDSTPSNAQPICKDCVNGSCLVPEKYNTYTVEEHGEVPFDEEAMMTEIYERGPIGCGVFSDPLEKIPYGFTGVFETEEKGETGHDISVVGWGTEEETGLPYWVMRNSWGEYFADQGYIKVRRGNNTINIEDSCYFANPKNTWKNQVNPTTGAEKKTVYKNIINLQRDLEAANLNAEVAAKVAKYGSYKGSFTKSAVEYSKITGPEPKDWVKDSDLPERFWWGDVDGVNYLSWTVNQHIPEYCGSCWAQAAVGAMSDRINIANHNLSRRFLSAQVLINCGVGDCLQGGDQNVAYEWIMKHGVPEYGCQNYIAQNPEHATCSGLQKCRNCPFFGEGPCFAVKEYTSWTGTQHGKVKGANDMKKELWARGSLACGINATDEFYFGYKGGVYQSGDQSAIDHVVTVVGWGKDDVNGEFWIIRNSWGTYWGENGYFRIKMHENNLRIEEDCSWIVPEVMGASQAEGEVMALDA